MTFFKVNDVLLEMEFLFLASLQLLASFLKFGQYRIAMRIFLTPMIVSPFPICLVINDFYSG